MICCRSNFSSWKRQKEASTSSHAATGPLGCSVCLTMACYLRSGLLLQRPSSSPAISVSGTFGMLCDWNLDCTVHPFPLSVLKIEEKKIVIKLSHVFKLSQPCINNRFNDAIAPHGCRMPMWWHRCRKNLRAWSPEGKVGARQRGTEEGTSVSHSYSEGWFNEKVTHNTGNWNAALVVLHPFDQPTWDMEMLKILFI